MKIKQVGKFLYDRVESTSYSNDVSEPEGLIPD